MAEYLLKTGEAGTVVPEQDKVAFHDRHEFADVPRPGIAPDGIQNGRGDNGGVFPIPFEDVGDEERHVFQTIPQGGDFKADARQTEIQIQPERAHLDQIQQLLVRGADDPHVDGNEAIAPYVHDFLCIQHAQEAELHSMAHVPDLVKKEGAAVRQFEKPRFAAALGPGKSPLLIAEQFAFQQRVRQGRAVDHHKRLLGPFAGGVQGVCDKLLAGARFAVDVDRDVRGRVAGDVFFQLHDAGRLADDVPCRVVGHEPA